MDSSEVMNIEPNSKLFDEGTKVDKIYFLVKGSISAQRSDQSNEI